MISERPIFADRRSELHRVLLYVVVDLGWLGADVMIRLGISQSEFLGRLRIAVEDELPRVLAVCRIVVIAQDRKTQSLVAQPPAQLGARLTCRSLRHVERVEGQLAIHVGTDVHYAIHVLRTAR